MSPEWLTAKQMRDEAQRNVKKPIYPAPPQGRPVTKYTTQQICTQVPRFKGLSITFDKSCNNIEVPVSTVESSPSTSENKDWNDRVAEIKRDYEQAVEVEASRIAERQRSELKSYAKDMIQISTGIFGLIASIVALIVGYTRGKIPSELYTGKDKTQHTDSVADKVSTS